MSHRATSWLSHIPATQLSNSEFRVLFHLCDCHNPSAGCFPTQAYLRANAGVGNGTLNRALNGLEAKRLIRRERVWDEGSKRQLPTRYMLGFEFEEPQEPTPNMGDGSGSPKGPKNGPSRLPPQGDGAVSHLRHDPSPISGGVRLPLVGEGTCKEPVNNPGGSPKQGISPFLLRLAERIAAGEEIRADGVDPIEVRQMLRNRLVTEDQLHAAGIAFQKTG